MHHSGKTKYLYKPVTLEQLPNEMLDSVAYYLPGKFYNRLRACSGRLRRLDPQSRMGLLAYIATTEECERIGKAKEMRDVRRPKLEMDDVGDAAVLFMASNGHSHEFVRILQSYKSHLISAACKLECFHTVMIKVDLLRNHTLTFP